MPTALSRTRADLFAIEWRAEQSDSPLMLPFWPGLGAERAAILKSAAGAGGLAVAARARDADQPVSGPEADTTGGATPVAGETSAANDDFASAQPLDRNGF